MSIDKDIYQRSFKSEHQKAIINLIYTINCTAEQLKPIFEKEDLTLQQFNILRILRGSERPLSTLQIRERMLDKMSDTSRIVGRLVIKGLVKKVTCKEDKRLVDVSITKKGKNILHKIDQQEDEVPSIVMALANKEAITLNKIRQSN